MFRCDNCCNEKALSLRQFASVVIKEGEESYTTNSCQQCYKKFLVARGDKPLTKWQWYEFVEKKAHRGRHWKNGGQRTIRARNVGILLPGKRWSKEVSRICVAHSQLVPATSSPSSRRSVAANSTMTQRPNNHESDSARRRTEWPLLTARQRSLRTRTCPTPKPSQRTTAPSTFFPTVWQNPTATLENHPAHQRCLAARNTD